MVAFVSQLFLVNLAFQSGKYRQVLYSHFQRVWQLVQAFLAKYSDAQNQTLHLRNHMSKYVPELNRKQPHPHHFNRNNLF